MLGATGSGRFIRKNNEFFLKMALVLFRSILSSIAKDVQGKA